MKLSRHKIEDVPFQQAKHIGGTITPTIVVLHDTASRLDEGSAARYLLDNPARVSVHFVIERSGAVVQQVATNKRANHAGTSSYHGRDHCNNFSIGIEIVNVGRMTAADDGYVRTWFKKLYAHGDDAIGQPDIMFIQTPEHGAGYWMDYTSEQIDALMELLDALFRGIPTLKDIRTHWYISPGRKVATNPLFPLEAVRSKILGRDDPAELDAENGSAPFEDMFENEMFFEVETRGSALNMRRWPSFNPNVLTSIPDGTVVPGIRTGEFGGRTWVKVLYDGQEGWVVERYLAPIVFADGKEVA